jgi:hypothetical protein
VSEVAHVDLTIRLRKSEAEGKFFAVVTEPELPDSDDDRFSPAEIEKMAHEFMRNYAMAKAEHSPDVHHGGRDAGADLIENFIAPCDLTLAGEPVTAGSWVQAWQVDDPQTRQEIERGEITGVSLEGTGVRHPIMGGSNA